MFAEGLGRVETSQVIIVVSTAIVAIMALVDGRHRLVPRLRAMLIAFAVGALYIAGEEYSWGQSLFHWDTPDYWAEMNKQEETNRSRDLGRRGR